MFKLVVLLSVAAMALAKPGVVAPFAYSAVVPAVSTVSVHGNPAVFSAPAVYRASAVYSAPSVYPSVYGAPVYGARTVVPVHHLHKRSVVAYSRPLVSAYSPVVSAYSAPVVSAYSPYSAVYPRAFNVHPY